MKQCKKILILMLFIVFTIPCFVNGETTITEDDNRYKVISEFLEDKNHYISTDDEYSINLIISLCKKYNISVSDLMIDAKLENSVNSWYGADAGFKGAYYFLIKAAQMQESGKSYSKQQGELNLINEYWNLCFGKGGKQGLQGCNDSELREFNKMLINYIDSYGTTTEITDKAIMLKIETDKRKNIGIEVTAQEKIENLKKEIDQTVKDNNLKKLEAFATKENETTKTQQTNFTLNEIIKNADSFTEKGENAEDETISTKNLSTFSNSVYNIFLSVGIIIAFIVGGILGIKFMVSGYEGKAEVKTMLVPYIVGCIVLFGAFGIWRIVVLILQG